MTREKYASFSHGSDITTWWLVEIIIILFKRWLSSEAYLIGCLRERVWCSLLFFSGGWWSCLCLLAWLSVAVSAPSGGDEEGLQHRVLPPPPGGVQGGRQGSRFGVLDFKTWPRTRDCDGRCWVQSPHSPFWYDRLGKTRAGGIKKRREGVSEWQTQGKEKNVTKKLKENIKRWRILENPNYGLIVSQLHCYNFLLYFIIQELRKKLITEEKLMATQKLWVNDPNKHLQQKKKKKMCCFTRHADLASKNSNCDWFRLSETKRAVHWTGI